MRPARRLVPTLAAVLALGVGAADAHPQALDRVDELARLGRTEEARTALIEWWEGDRAEASRRDLQRGLWLRGRLTVDPVQAELDFQRLVVLYPSGPFTPQALFRLAQSAHAQGDADAARSHVASLTRDYPAAPSRAEAEAWLRDAGPVPPPPDRPEPDRTAAAPPGGPNPDGGEPDVAIADTVATDRTEPDPPAADLEPVDPDPVDAEVLSWMVQFGAFAEEARAVALHGELIDAGVEARLARVDGSGFLHVRIGRFSNRIDANTQLEEVVAQGFSAAIVRDERAETLVER